MSDKERDTLPEDEGADSPESAPSLHPLEIEQAKLAGEVAVIDRQLHSLTERRRDLQRELDRVTFELERVKPPTDHIRNLQDYINSQQAQRAARVERANRALGVGITAESLSGKSPLDQAMSKKNRRGIDRPQRNMKAS